MDPIADRKNIRVADNGYGVIGKRVAAVVALQEDMSLAGVSDVVTDWRARAAIRNGFRLFGAASEHTSGMRAAGLEVAVTLDDLPGQADIVVDCTPKRVAAKNIDDYATALDRDATRIVSCNTTSIVDGQDQRGARHRPESI